KFKFLARNSELPLSATEFLAQRAFKFLALAQRDHSSLSDAYPDFGLRLDNLPWPRPNSIFTTFNP
ncbi:hypothetical protein A2U01_0118241, partial [Trifolium medium]|nr:hypothetical protein [Trifolium medium]